MLIRILLLLSLLFSLNTAFAGVAGTFLVVAGDVKIIAADGTTRIPQRKDTLNEGETLVTGKDGTAQLKMADNGLLAVRPATRFTVDAFVYKGSADGTERSFISLLRGGFRALTGVIGKLHPENYRITTPLATIGIRGTDHEPFHIPPPAPGEQAVGKPGTYDKVNSGSVVLKTEVGEVLVQAGQAAYAGAANAPPQVLPTVPDFYRTSAAPAASAIPSTLPNATSPPALSTPIITPGLDSGGSHHIP